MIINHDLEESMKLVYDLKEKLRVDARQVELAQSLTLNPDKPLLGLKGSCGLFGSDEWWDNIQKGKIPVVEVKGIVRRAYISGQDRNVSNNTIELMLEDGSVSHHGIYINDKSDVGLFVPGARVVIVYGLDELKKQPARDGSVNYSYIALEMTVSI